jgi:hypothetical protein
MPDIIAATTDDEIFSTNAAYSTVRSATTGTVSGNTGITDQAGIIRFNSRGGSPPCRIHRFFLDFDTSGISVTPSSANLKFTINTQASETSNSNLIAVKSDAFTGASDTLQSSDYDNIDISTPYTAEMDHESAANGTTITTALNSDALSDMVANDNFRLALISHAHDFTNSEPSDTLSRVLTIRTANHGTLASRPTISYVEGASGPANLTSLNGITKSNITNVNTITLANITSINTIA